MSGLVDTFLNETESEDAKLHKQLSKLLDDAGDELAEVVGRFNRSGGDALTADEREEVRKVLGLMYRPNAKGLQILSGILGYLDVDASSVLDHREVMLAIEVLELFCKADSENDTLSNKELEILQAVLMHMDSDGNGKIDPAERNALRDELWEPEAFLEKQKADNPLVREILGLD